MSFFTIIIPTRNSADSLATALESLAMQTFKDFEVLIQDGKSTDNTLAIAKSFEPRLSKLRIAQEADKGIYDAMNKALSHASGDYLFFMGADDRLFDPQVLEKVHASLSDATVDVLYGNVVGDCFDGEYDGEFDQRKLFKKNISHQALFCHNSIYNKTGKFDLKYPVLADWDHNMKWFLDPTISHRHLDLTISDYGAEGFSSNHTDAAFWNDKLFNFYRYSGRHLDPNLRCMLLKKMATHPDVSGDFFRSFAYKLRYRLCRLRLRIGN